MRVHPRCARLLIGAHQRIKRTRKTHQPQCRLTHGRSGIDRPLAVGHAHNFGFLEPGGKLAIHFDPGTRYAYSGDGLITL